jgi:Asp-tRNA(Asn)/Glu-tRNA(Gln) amidotransferase A subunit family amidase
MSQLQTVVNRLREQLKISGIPVDDTLVQEIADRGFLQIPMLFDSLIEGQPVDLVPDYLAAWLPSDQTNEAVPAGSTRPVPAVEISATTAELRRGAFSPVELTEKALARLAERDPELNAFQLVLVEEARVAARRAESELRQGVDRGPLHGIPMAIKDLLHYAGTPTTAGSTIRAGEVIGEDAAVVEKLRAAGAIIIGKTRMSEFAYAPGSINPHYGSTRNPRAPQRDTGGSSSGSAAAVADGIVYAALGSDTGGSIRIPAAQCGLAGLKPTFGRVSLHGAINLAWSLDHLGPLTRTVADAALLLAALEGPDPRDPRTRPAPALPVTTLLEREPMVRGLRIGVLRDDGSGAPLAGEDVLAAWRAGLNRLEAAGATLVEIDLPGLRTMWALGGALLAQEALAYHLPMLRTRLHELGEFMKMRIVAAFAYPPGGFVRGQQLRRVLRRQADAIFDQVDLLSTPTLPAGALPLGTISPTFFTMPFNLLGWPALTVPCGADAQGLPLGLQLVGQPWDDLTVLRAGLALEQG